MKFVLSAVSEREAIAPGGPLRGRLGDAAELVRGRLEFKRLDMDQPAALGSSASQLSTTRSASRRSRKSATASPSRSSTTAWKSTT
jgi:hypothetical protein